jgi:glutathione S-transferase
MIKLYDFVLSANCYKVRLLLGLLDVPYEVVPVDFHPGREHTSAAFRRINPFGHIPVIDDDGYVLWDAHAILVYLATQYDASRQWCPVDDPRRLGDVASWMLVAEGTANTASAARLHVNFGYEFDVEACRAGAHRLFRALDEHLWRREQEGRAWFGRGDHPTLADLALFPDVMLSEEGGISRQPYPALRRWTDRFKRIPGFSVMPGIFPAGPGPDA